MDNGIILSQPNMSNSAEQMNGYITTTVDFGDSVQRIGKSALMRNSCLQCVNFFHFKRLKQFECD